MINLDEEYPDGMPEPGNADSDVNTLVPPWVEYARCTCLDRARMALEQTGQHHCALQMSELQQRFDIFPEAWVGYDPNKPVEILDHILSGEFLDYEKP